jgi:hypothetical protein
MGKADPSMRLTTDRSDCGHDSGGPSGELPHWCSRIKRAIPLLPARNAISGFKFVNGSGVYLPLGYEACLWPGPAGHDKFIAPNTPLDTPDMRRFVPDMQSFNCMKTLPASRVVH